MFLLKVPTFFYEVICTGAILFVIFKMKTHDLTIILLFVYIV